MKKLRLLLLVALAIVFCHATPPSVTAQDVDVLVTPDELELEPGESVQLETYAFSLSGNLETPAGIDSVIWEVTPDSLASITDDGFFIAGQRPGVVEIKATFLIGDRVIVKIVVIRIGKLPLPLYAVKVVPERAVVPVGHEQQFEVRVATHLNTTIPDYRVRWQVLPDDLGRIDDAGLFFAGDVVGQGKVVAYVEAGGVTIRAAAHVTVSPLPGGAITGNIIDDNGAQPLAGATVKAFRLGRLHWVRHGESDNNGNYEITDLIPGNYVLFANARGYIGEYYDNTRNYLEAFVLTVGEDDTLRNKDFGLSKGAKIKGQVVADADSLPLAGAHVVARLKLNPRFARHVLTDRDGNYSIDALPTGSYVVRANLIGYAGEYYDDVSTWEAATPVNVSEPDSAEGKNFGLATQSAISGQIVDAADQSPIGGATIHVFKAFTVQLDVALHHRPLFRETKSNDQGEYILQVPPGNYYVLASAQGFNPEFFDNARKFADAVTVPVKADSHSANIDFDLVARSSIAGIVEDQNSGAPIAGAVIEAFYENELLDVNAASTGFRAISNESGQYRIENLPTGKYLVRAVARTYLPEYYNDVANKREATIVPVADGTEITDINFTLEKGGAISGFVGSDGDSLPIPDAVVRVFETNTGRHVQTYTDREGVYRAAGLRSGDYYVHVAAENFFAEFYLDARHRGEAKLVAVDAPMETTDIDVYLRPFEAKRGSIAGRVISERNDGPLVGAVVVAMSAQTRHPYFAFSGRHGFYQITDLPAGRYYVYAWSPGFIGEFWENVRRFRNATAVIVIDNQTSAGIDFDLQPYRRRGIYTVRGRIAIRGGDAPAHGVMVQARIGDEVEVNAITDVDGSFVMEDLPAGQYTIEATAPGYADGFWGGSTPETATPVTLGNGADLADINLTLDIETVTSAEAGNNGAVPEIFALAQNYPNPFNPETTIKYQVAELSEVSLRVYNLMGQEVRSLVQTTQQPGAYTAVWDGRDNMGRSVASGIYIFQMRAGANFKMSRRMVLLK
jgi:hypothetical protein